MKYSIIICPNSKKSIATKQAYFFIEAILQDSQPNNPHKIDVFFYGLAVKSAFNCSLNWQNITKQGVKLTACSNIAELYKPASTYSHFSIAGIGQWMESTLDADKNIEFI